MKKASIVLFICLCHGLISAQDKIIIAGKLIDKNEQTIPYASIINVSTSKHGTTSDENGNFYLKTRNNLNDKIQINALGFFELRITVAELAKLIESKFITLKEKPLNLGEVEIKGERYEQDFIGKSTQLLKKTDSSYFSDQIGEGPGYSEGVFVRPHRKTEGIIDKIHFFVASDSPLNQPFTIRLLRSRNKLKNNRGYKIDEFDEMVNSILLVEKVEAGWNTFELYDYEVFVDSRSFFVLFTNLESFEQAKVRDLQETASGLSLAAFADRTPNEVFKALSFNGIILFLANDRVKTPIPAVYLEYSTLKD